MSQMYGHAEELHRQHTQHFLRYLTQNCTKFQIRNQIRNCCCTSASSISVTFLHRKLLYVWRENAALLVEVRLMEQQAQNHFHHFLRLKVIKQSDALVSKTITVIPLPEPLLILYFALKRSRCSSLGEKKQHMQRQSATSRGKHSAGLRGP